MLPQYPSSKKLTCGTVYDEKNLKAILVDDLQSSIRHSFRHWWVEQQDALLEDLTQKRTFHWTSENIKFAASGWRIPTKEPPTRQSDRECRSRKNRVIDVQEPSYKFKSSRDLKSSPSYSSFRTAMSTSDVFAAVELGKIVLNDSLTMNLVAYFRDILKTSPLTL